MIERRQLAYLLHTTLPGATLLGALVFAPWFWGCTWPLGIEILEDLLLAATAAWGCGMLLRREKSGLSPVLLVTVLSLLGEGWLMALNGHSVCGERTGLYIPVAGHFPWLPGSIAQNNSRADMVRLTGLLGAGVAFAWLGRSVAWRRRILWTMAATGGSIVILGCWQRWTGATDIFWNSARHLDFFFATYRNITNAGEYFNLVLPVAAALVLVEAVKRHGPVRLACGVTLLVLLAVGSLISGSKLAPAATCLGVLLFAVLQRKPLRAQAARVNGRSLVLTVLVVALMVAAIVWSVGLGVTWERWDHLLQGKNGDATWANRLRVDRVCGLAAPDAGLFGFGPGTFRAVFPYYSGFVEGDLRGVWTYAHDDYAQTMVEWGALGALLWSVYFFGALAVLARGWRAGRWRTEDRIGATGLLVAQIVLALTALGDFPLQIASIQLDAAAVLGLAWSSPGWLRARPAGGSHGLGEGRFSQIPLPARISLRG